MVSSGLTIGLLYLLRIFWMCSSCRWIVLSMSFMVLSGGSLNVGLLGVFSFCIETRGLFHNIFNEVHYMWPNWPDTLYILINKTMQEKITEAWGPILSRVKQHPKTSVAVTLALLLGLAIRKLQSKIIYIPDVPGLGHSPSANPYPYRNPAQHRMTHRDIEVKTPDNLTLRGWYLFKEQEQEPAKRLILYYHQNAGNIGTRLPFIRHLVENTCSDVMIVAYRGYSDSDGSPSEQGIKKDGIAILNSAIAQANQRNLPLIVFGRSLGGAVAINSCAQLNNQQDVKGMVLQNTFTSISDVGLHLFGGAYTKHIIKFFFAFLLANHWESYRLMGKLTSPILFIKSQKDELIPIEQMDRLESMSKSRHEEHRIKNGTHNETWTRDSAAYFNKLNRFFASL